MYCFQANKCNNLECPVRQQNLLRCWEYFEKKAAEFPEYKKKLETCVKCNYRLGWDIGLISERLFENKIAIDELITEKPSEQDSPLKKREKRFCYEIMDCKNLNCPVREQQIIRCFKYFEPKGKEEKEKLTCCNRECEGCFYKSGWDMGLLTEDDFLDVIERKKNSLKRQSQSKVDLIVELYMSELAKKPLSRKEEKELEKKIASDKKASELFLIGNLKLVTKIAQKFSSKLSLMDLIQEGNIGLIKAISKFDYRLGYKFSTYAAYWIKYYMQKAVSEQAVSISIPCHLIAVANKIKHQIRKFEEQLSRAPTIDELSNILGIAKEKIINILNVTKSPVSIQSKVSSDDDNEETLEFYIEDKHTLTPDEALLEKEKVDLLNQALETLNERQRYVVENFYGINCEEASLAEIGRRTNISRERARQILHSSLVKLSQYPSILSLK